MHGLMRLSKDKTINKHVQEQMNKDKGDLFVMA